LLKTRYNELSSSDKEKSKIKFKDYDKHDNNLKMILNSLVYHLLINKTKAQMDDGNFMAYLATLIKCRYTKKKSKCHDPKYGDNGYSLDALKILLNEIINTSDYTILDLDKIFNKYESRVTYDMYMEYQKKHKKINKIVNEYNLETKKNIPDNSKIKELKKIYDELLNRIDYLEKELKISETIDINNYDVDKKTVLIIGAKYSTEIKKEIFFNNVKYNICSCVIGIKTKSGNHLICGIICNNKQFIYDSNNIFVEAEWTQGEKGVDTYLNNKEVLELYYKKPIFTGIFVLIYLKN
jgi:hypothetical protein